MWKWLRWGLIGAGILAIGGIVAANLWLWNQSGHDAKRAARELVYIVPAGTTERLGAGQAVNVLPNVIELAVGGANTLVIRNQDTAPIEVGGIKIATGQSYIQTFETPGAFDLMCSAHPSDKIRVIVKP